MMYVYFVGVYIFGLYLDGAGWDRRNCRLIEPTPKVLYTPLPVAHVFATNVDKPSKATNLYECPVYKKPRRTDLTYIFPLQLKTNKNPDHWILRGVALLCDIKWTAISCWLLFIPIFSVFIFFPLCGVKSSLIYLNNEDKSVYWQNNSSKLVCFSPTGFIL